MKTLHILLVEDNEGDIVLTTDALEDSEIKKEISVVKDGKEAIDFVNQKGKYAGFPLPDIIFLDINLPRKNGYEVLKYIKGSEKLKTITVVMLSTSHSKKDIAFAAENFANYYITKPIEVPEILKIIRKIRVSESNTP